MDSRGATPHPDYHAITFDGSGNAYVGTDGGLWRLNLAGRTWDDLNANGLQTHELYSVALHPTDRNRLLEGSQDNGIALTTDGGKTWNVSVGGDGGMVRFFSGRTPLAFAVQENGTWGLSRDLGKTFAGWRQVGGDSYPWMTVFAIDPAINGRLVIGSNTTVWWSRNTGITWRQASPALPGGGGGITALSYAPSNGNVLYVGFGNGKLFRTDHAYDGTATANWPEIFPADPWGTHPITSIAVDPANTHTAYIGIGDFDTNQVWKISDGAAPVAIDTGKPNLPVNALVLDSSGANPVLYAGTDAGVYQGTLAAGAWTWAPFGAGLPTAQVLDLQLQTYGTTKVLAAATHGRGAWTIDIPPAAAAVGARVWNDLKADGIEGAREPGIAGVTVQLYTSSSILVATTTTDSTGHYLFTVDPGSYYVTVVAPVNDIFSPEDQGTDPTLDSDVNSSGQTYSFSLANGQTYTDADAGLYSGGSGGGSIGDFVWNDVDDDGIQDPEEHGLPGVTVNLLDGSGNLLASTTTDNTGHYQFSGLASGNYIVQVVAPAGFQFSPEYQGGDDTVDSDVNPSGQTDIINLAAGQTFTEADAGLLNPNAGSVGDYVWNDLNDNGIQDAGEPGLANVPVYLFDGLGNWLASTTTDADGYYQFVGLAPGNYQIQVIAPAGFQFSPEDQGTDPALDSDVNASGWTAVFSLSAGAYQSDLAAGLFNPGSGGSGGSIGDYVWNDLNDNGIQESSEPGLSGVTVNLLDGLGNWLSSTSTDTTGHYQFTGLAAGNYQVQVVAPSGYQFSPEHQGSDDTVDSDVNSSGQTALISLAAGQTFTEADAGLFNPGSGGSGGALGPAAPLAPASASSPHPQAASSVQGVSVVPAVAYSLPAGPVPSGAAVRLTQLPPDGSPHPAGSTLAFADALSQSQNGPDFLGSDLNLGNVDAVFALLVREKDKRNGFVSLA